MAALALQAANDLGKPLVLEEFGKNASASQVSAIRDPWYSLVQGAVEASLSNGGPLRGSLFWQWVRRCHALACVQMSAGEWPDFGFS